MDGFSFLACLFGFPETKWYRVHPDDMRGKGMIPSNQPSHERIAVDNNEHEKEDKSLVRSNIASPTHRILGNPLTA